MRRSMKFGIGCWTAILLASWIGSSSVRAAEKSPVRLIFDTDIESDFDDVGAVALLNALADKGEVDILAMGVSATNPHCAPCLNALNTYYGRPDIPIGVVHDSPLKPRHSAYSGIIVKEFPHQLRSAKDAPVAEILYRRVLAKQPDHSVVIVTVGYLTNLRHLLETHGDQYSPLDGRALVARKVKAWVCMGGRIPEGRESNLSKDTASSAYCLEHWPTRIIFSPFMLGVKVITGPALQKTPKSNPIRRAYELAHGLKGHASWDQTAVFYAVRGLNGGLKDVWGIRGGGSLHMRPDGTDEWQSKPLKDEWYLVQKMSPYKVSRMIDHLMALPPERLQAAKSSER